MRFASDLLYRLLRATAAGDAFPASQDLELPALLLPTVTVPGPVPVAQSSLVTATYRESFFQTRRLGNSGVAAAFSERLAILGRGLWEVEVFLSAVSNFTAADFIVSPGCILRVVDPAGAPANILEHQLVLNVPAYLRGKSTWLFEADLWAFDASVPVTAAGQLVVAEFGVRANRLN